MSNRLSISMPDRDTEPFEMDTYSLADGGYAYDLAEAVLSAPEIVALGTALMRRESMQMEEARLDIRDHAQACMMAADVEIGQAGDA